MVTYRFNNFLKELIEISKSCCHHQQHLGEMNICQNGDSLEDG